MAAVNDWRRSHSDIPLTPAEMPRWIDAVAADRAVLIIAR